MIGYSELEVFHPSHLVIFHRAQALVDRLDVLLPETQKKVRCHELARAISRSLAMPRSSVADGTYGPVDHSWIVLPHPISLTSEEPLVNVRRSLHDSILDVYAVGRLPMVQLIYNSAILPEYKLYKEGPVRSDIDEAMVEHLYRASRTGEGGP